MYPFVPLIVSFHLSMKGEEGTYDPRAVSRPIPLYGIVVVGSECI